MHPEIEEILKKAIVVDCCVLTPYRFALITEEDMGEDHDPWSLLPPVNFAFYNREKDNWGGHKFGKNTVKWPRAAHTKLGEMLVIGERGEVWYHGLGENKQFEASIPRTVIRGVYDIKNIHGTIYVTGTHRSVVRRDGVDQWTLISKPIKDLSLQSYGAAKEKGGDFRPGFRVIDGFAADRDLYAGGGHGDVWRYDGKTWHPVDIPLPRMQISGICCAEDGWVYIAGRFGALLKGREDEWHGIRQSKTKSDFRDITDYNGKVYVCTEGDLYTIEGEDLQAVDFGDMRKPFSFSALYANHGMLMATGSYSACLFDGQRWQSLYESGTAAAIGDQILIEHVTDQLEDIIDDLGDVADKLKDQKP